MDDLTKPLGQDKPEPPKIDWRGYAPTALAAFLGLMLAVFFGWMLLVDDPLGGEPMAWVTADIRAVAPKKATEEPAPAAPANVETAKPATAQDRAANSQTVTIIDGSSGKSQEVQLSAAADATRGAIDPKMIEPSRHGSIPRIAADGARPADLYARPIKEAILAGTPRVAIVIGGLGVGLSSTSDAIAKLPAAVTLAFTPYGTDLDRWVSRARGNGHEILLQVPMEPLDYPENDTGPHTLLTSLSSDQNNDRLHWIMSRFQGYVGISNFMGTRFTAREQAMTPLLREVAKRGLIYFDDGTSPRSVVLQVASSTNMAFAKADIAIDVVATTAEIESQLKKLEALARQRSATGGAIGYANSLPISIERIAQWIKLAESRGIAVVPISMAASKPKSR